MKQGLPKGVFWYPSATLIWGALLWVWMFTRVLRIPSLVDVMREGLLDFDVMDRDAKRLYVYSVVDELVGVKGLDGEVEKAREKGLVVKVLREETTPHVQHMLLDAERYWKSIEELWESAI